MTEGQEAQVSEAQIAVHWQEEEYFYPSRNFIAQANMTDEKIYDRFSRGPFPGLLQRVRRPADWYQYWHTTLDTSNAALLEVVRRRAGSTPATTASTGTWPSTATRRP